MFVSSGPVFIFLQRTLTTRQAVYMVDETVYAMRFKAWPREASSTACSLFIYMSHRYHCSSLHVDETGFSPAPTT